MLTEVDKVAWVRWKLQGCPNWVSYAMLLQATHPTFDDLRRCCQTERLWSKIEVGACRWCVYMQRNGLTYRSGVSTSVGYTPRGSTWFSATTNGVHLEAAKAAIRSWYWLQIGGRA